MRAQLRVRGLDDGELGWHEAREWDSTATVSLAFARAADKPVPTELTWQEHCVGHT